MPDEVLNIVWLKRDIRTNDHAALQAAEQSGNPYLIIFLFEPSMITYPDTSERHLQFQYRCLQDFNHRMKLYNQKVHVFHAEAAQVFEYLLHQYKVAQVFSYEEHGHQLSWDRDRQVRDSLSKANVKWTEFKKNGVIRGSKNRIGWDKQWYVTMNEPQIQNEYAVAAEIEVDHPFQLQEDLREILAQYPEEFQPAGETFAWKYLRSFTEGRGANYHRFISKPELSRTSCSRLSPYLAWGNLSIKQAVQFIKHHPTYPDNKRAYQGLLTRLKWHCHFIQKFEVECDYETRCINRGYELLEHDDNTQFVAAWQEGKTGFPLVDACMRCVRKTGWINFRMRAMVVSLLCHHLDQDWRRGVYHLAKMFLDYEPGIHYPQFQMQAGTTGVNTIRMYNPVKQATDHDSEGNFIRKWVPELSKLPTEFVHEPWRMTGIEQELHDFRLGEDYPLPIIDLVESGRAARAKIWGHRKNDKVKEERIRILATHTRNKN
ncbi:MAG: deoxyribodipyrimidine photo-lyase [Bacteroidota bacterium]